MTASADHWVRLLADYAAPLTAESLFGRPGLFELEAGTGRGDFIVEYGRRFPHLNLLGVEFRLLYLRRGARKLGRAGLNNVALFHAEWTHLAAEYLPDASLAAVHVYFPDPWPKKRHAKRRFFVPERLALVARKLAPGGALHFRTDDEPTFTEACAVTIAAGGWRETPTPPEIREIPTGYERLFEAMGKRTLARSWLRDGP